MFNNRTTHSFMTRVLTLPELLEHITTFLDLTDIIHLRAVNTSFYWACVPRFVLDLDVRQDNCRCLQYYGHERLTLDNDINNNNNNNNNNKDDDDNEFDFSGCLAEDEDEDDEQEQEEGRCERPGTEKKKIEALDRFMVPFCNNPCAEYIRSISITRHSFNWVLEKASRFCCQRLESLEYLNWGGESVVRRNIDGGGGGRQGTKIVRHKRYESSLEMISKFRRLKRLGVGYVTRPNDVRVLFKDLVRVVRAGRRGTALGEDQDKGDKDKKLEEEEEIEGIRGLEELSIHFEWYRNIDWKDVLILLKAFPDLTKLHLVDGVLCNGSLEDSNPLGGLVFPKMKSFLHSGGSAGSAKFLQHASTIFPQLEDLQVESLTDFEEQGKNGARSKNQQQFNKEFFLPPGLKRFRVDRIMEDDRYLEKFFKTPLPPGLKDLFLMGNFRTRFTAGDSILMDDWTSTLSSQTKMPIKPLKRLELFVDYFAVARILNMRPLCDQLQVLKVKNGPVLFEELLHPILVFTSSTDFAANRAAHQAAQVEKVKIRPPFPLEILTPAFLKEKLPFLSTLTVLHLSSPSIGKTRAEEVITHKMLNQILQSSPHLLDFEFMDRLFTLEDVFSGLGRDSALRPKNPPGFPLPRPTNAAEARQKAKEERKHEGFYRGIEDVTNQMDKAKCFRAYRRRHDWNFVESDTEVTAATTKKKETEGGCRVPVPDWLQERPFLEKVQIRVDGRVCDAKDVRRQLWYRFRFLDDLVVESDGDSRSDDDDDGEAFATASLMD